MTNTTAPFRADHVGSILRTAPLKEARAKREKGEIDAAALKAVEDEEIRKIIKKQEEVGLKLATDGEFRRSWWQFDFFKLLDGAELVKTEHGIKFAGVETRPEDIAVTGKLGYSGAPMIDHFEFLKANCAAGITPKMTLPSPTVLQYRVGPKPVQDGIYRSTEELLHDLGLAYRKAIKAFGDAGCRYLQLDDTSYAHLCDKERRAMLQGRGEDPVWIADVWADMINSALKDKPADMVTAMHLCRGNFRSTFVSSGGYEPVADVLFNKIGIDGYFLEYDSDRAGDFAPLRFLPKGKKRVVLGLVTSKTGTLESKDLLKKRIEEAAKIVPLEQLCLSPQCGFASTEEGNVLAEDEQWAKLRLCVEVAEEVWGR
ncbi:5-methyltetrahydropteroyltriglutamate--homocysteine S-methyltransferase [Pseudorhodoplanes sp.]|uniref:5-methyltetrahydropteroyltriglutamate-- homocysteine S-methyltransferase n=1 Tax=Pseudorhodoplanes sp. TaxID=1934341 RepID=UPI00391B7008